MRLLVTRRLTAAAESAIALQFDAVFRNETTPLTEAEAAAALRDYDAILPTLGDGFTAAAFAAAGAPRTRVLANFGVGYNHLAIGAAAEAGVIVTNTPDVVTDATADIAMTLILMTARRAGEGERLVRAGLWEGWHPTQMLGIHVTGRTVGIVGMGRIGQAIARRCHFGFGMTVLYTNRSPKALDFPAERMELDELLHAADIVVLAVPGGRDTHHLIDAGRLAEMRPHAILVNIARGDIVDEAALIAALDGEKLAGAGLDVYEREPLVPEKLRCRDDVVLLPHLGTAAEEVRTDMALRALANLVAVRDGHPPPDRVD